MNKKTSIQTLSTLSLVLLITGAIDSIRNLPAAAWFGSQLIFFFILSAIIFLIPVALVSAELSTLWSEEQAGIYGWVKKAFGQTLAFITIWLQWVNTLVWYPTILLFISSTLAYLFFPESTNNTFFAITCTITIFWALTIMALRGIHASAKFASVCAVLGMILPMGLIILLGFLWVALGHPSAISFELHDLIPKISQQDSWISLTAIMTSFLGMELAAVHVREIQNPQKTYPKAIFYSIILILITMIFGSLSIAMVLPKHEINLVIGVLQTCTSFLKYHHLEFLMPALVVLIFVGSIGSMVNWIIAPAQGLAYSAKDKILPSWFAQLNSQGTPSRILITQALVVTLLCLSFLLMPNINAMYWFFTALSTELYMCMYVLMFFAAIKIKKQFATLERPFQIPGKKLGYYFTCVLGLMGCSITLYIGFFPPQEALSLPHPELYKFYFGLGLILMLAPALLGLAYRKIFGQNIK
jgi:amino acid transporter